MSQMAKKNKDFMYLRIVSLQEIGLSLLNFYGSLKAIPLNCLCMKSFFIDVDGGLIY